MILETGDMWQVFNQTSLFCITTNAVIKNDGSLVMGTGIALQAKEKLEYIDFYLGRKIENMALYGLVVIDNFTPQLMGAFQVKYHWRDKANLDVIRWSTVKLHNWIIENNPTRVDLNFPGIGNGKLNEADVLSIVSELPDSVHVWSYE